MEERGTRFIQREPDDLSSHVIHGLHNVFQVPRLACEHRVGFLVPEQPMGDPLVLLDNQVRRDDPARSEGKPGEIFMRLGLTIGEGTLVLGDRLRTEILRLGCDPKLQHAPGLSGLDEAASAGVFIVVISRILRSGLHEGQDFRFDLVRC